MRSALVGLVLAGVAGSAMAAGDELAGAADTSYSAKVFYTVDFGGAKSGAQTVGLRFGNAIAERNNAPAFLSAKFDGQALPTVMLSGTPVAGPSLSANAAAAGGMLSSLTVGEWVVVGVTAIAFGSIATKAAGDDEIVVAPAASGTGTGG